MAELALEGLSSYHEPRAASFDHAASSVAKQVTSSAHKT